MREISTEEIRIGEHVMIDGVEYVAEEAGQGDPCMDCAFSRAVTRCSGFIGCDGIIFKRVGKEPVYRPYNDTEEMIADWKERFKAKDWPAHSMPLIWIWEKGDAEKTFVTGFRRKEVNTADAIIDMVSLLRGYTYLDGSPCGKEATP